MVGLRRVSEGIGKKAENGEALSLRMLGHRTLCVLLSVVLVVGFMPIVPNTAYAADGEGQESDPATDPEPEPEPEPAYAMLYSDGTLVFQRGDEPDAAHGTLLGAYTGFEEATLTIPVSLEEEEEDSEGELEACLLLESADDPEDSTGSGTGGDDAGGPDSGPDSGTSTSTGGGTSSGSGGSQGGTPGEEEDCYNIPWTEFPDQITAVEFAEEDDPITPKSMVGWFYGLENCVTIGDAGAEGATWNNIDTSQVYALEGAFSGCSSLKTVDVSGWDTSQVQYLAGAFADCSSLEALDVSQWDTSQVTSMAGTFFGCESLTSLDVSGWDVSSVMDMWCTFAGCTSLETLNVASWDVSNVEELFDLFADCASLQAVDVSGWRPAKIESSGNMFLNCTALTSIDLSGWACLESVEAEGYVSADDMLSGCTSLNVVTLPLGVYFWDLGLAEKAWLDEDGTLYESTQVMLEANAESTGSGSMRYGAAQPSEGWNACGSAEWQIDAQGCLHIRPLWNAETGVLPSNQDRMAGAAAWPWLEYAESIVSCEISSGVSFSEGIVGMLAGCVNLTSVNIGEWNVAGVRYADHLFEGCTSLTQMDLSAVGFSYALSTVGMFSGCTQLASVQLPYSLFTIGSSMFADCTALEEIDLPSALEEIGANAFSGSGVKTVFFAGVWARNLPNAALAFEGAGALETVYVPSGCYNAYNTALADALPEGAQVVAHYYDKYIQNIHVSGRAANTLIISWDAHVEPGITGYRVYRKPATASEEDYALVCELTGTDFGDHGLEEGVEYSYYVSGYDAKGRTVWGSPISATPGAPELTYMGTQREDCLMGGIYNELVFGVTGHYGLTGYSAGDVDHMAKAEVYLRTAEGDVLLGEAESMGYGEGSEVTEYSFACDMSTLPEGDCTLVARYTDPDGGVAEATLAVRVLKDAPAAPTACTAVGDSDAQAIAVSWEAAQSSDVESCVVYRRVAGQGEFEWLATVDGAERSYTDDAPDPNVTYEYRVVMVDLLGQESEPSPVAKASVHADTEAPEVTAITLPVPAGEWVSGTITVRVAAQDNEALQTIYLESSADGISWTWFNDVDLESATATAQVEFSLDTDEFPNGALYLRAVAIDESGNASSANAASANTMCYIDHSNAKKPEAVSAFFAAGDYDSINLSWTTAHELTTTGYVIYRKAAGDEGFLKLAEVGDRDTLSYDDTSAQSGLSYQYYVVGRTDAGREGEASEVRSASVLVDDVSPVVSSLTPDSNAVLYGTVGLSAKATDNLAVERLAIEASSDDGATWEQLGQAQAGALSVELDTRTLADGAIKVRAIAYDAAGNQSVPLERSYTVDNTGPQKVTGLSATCTSTTITLSWEDVADDDRKYYAVERLDGETWVCETISYTKLGCNIHGLAPATSYTYRVTAYDQCDNKGTPSDPLVATTLSDTTSPVVSSIYPGAGYVSGTVSVKMTAEDDYAVASIVMQTSRDAETWQDAETRTFAGKSASKSATFTIDTATLQEGSLYVRGYATDSAGNVGQPCGYTQYIIDRTAPEKVEGCKAQASEGAIELTWDTSESSDAASYKVYRSTDGETFTLVQSAAKLNYWDSAVQPGQSAWYKVAAVDAAGNEGEASEPVKATMPEDAVQPVVNGISPSNGTVMGPYLCTVAASFSDNNKISSMRIWYSVNDGEWVSLAEKTGVLSGNANVTAKLPADEFQDGDVIAVKAQCRDVSGNDSGVLCASYTYDGSAPEVSDATAERVDDAVQLSWTGGEEADLSAYYVFRSANDGEYRCIAKVEAGQPCAYVDESVKAGQTYAYRIDAYDKLGNIGSCDAGQVTMPEEEPALVLTAAFATDTKQEVDVEYAYDASACESSEGIVRWSYDFGDGTSADSEESGFAVHRFRATGEYTVKLIVTDAKGNKAACEHTVYVSEPQLVGEVVVSVVDGNGAAVPGMPVYFDLENTSDYVKATRSNGQVSFTAEVDTYVVGAYRDGYLPVEQTVAVTGGTTTYVTLTAVEKPIVEGSFTVTRMTFDEIVAAGIDISDPANQNMVQVNIHLTYAGRELNEVLYSQVTSVEPVVGDSFVIDWGEDEEDDPTGTGSGGGEVGDGGDPDVIYNRKSEITCVYVPVSDTDSGVLLVADVPVEASYLKEFFNVGLTILNNASSQYVLCNNQVTLNLPEGLTAVDSNYTSTSTTVSFAELAGQQSRTINWIVRGDVEGEYDISADYSGILSTFNAPVRAKFTSGGKVKVYGGSAMKITADVKSTIAYDAMYFDLSLTNVSDVDMYLPSLGLGEQMIKTLQNIEMLADDKTAGTVVDGYLSNMRYARMIKQALYDETGQAMLADASSVKVLAPGQKMTYRYAIYGAISYDDVATLCESVTEISGAQGAQVEVNSVEMDLYQYVDATEQMDYICSDATRSGMLSYIKDTYGSNYLYYSQALSDESDTLGTVAEASYRLADLVFTLDTESFDFEDVSAATRALVVRMLEEGASSAEQETSTLQLYADVASKVLGALSDDLKNNELSEDTDPQKTVAAFKEVASTNAAMGKLATALQMGGDDCFADKLGQLLLAQGIDSVVVRGVLNRFNINKSNLKATAVSETCNTLSSLTGLLADGAEDWAESKALVDDLIAIQSSYNQAMELFDILLDADIMNSVVREEVTWLRDQLVNGMDSQMEIFASEFLETALQEFGKECISEFVVPYLNNKFFEWGCGTGTFGVVYTLLKTAFKVGDYLFDWGGKVDNRSKIRAAGNLARALKQAITCSCSDDEAVNERTLSALTFLVRMNLEGEQVYIDIASEAPELERYSKVSIYNGGHSTQYGNFETYYGELKDRTMYYRDVLFGTADAQNGLFLDRYSAALQVGCKTTINASTLPENKDTTYSCSSSDETVVTASAWQYKSEGEITLRAVGEGSAVVTVSCSEGTQQIYVTVGEGAERTAYVSSMLDTQNNEVKETEVAIEWDDSWLMGNSRKADYNADLAATLAAVAGSAYGNTIYNQKEYVTNTLTSLGFGNIKASSYDYRSYACDQETATDDYAAYAFASKQVVTEAGSATVVAVVIRGEETQAEWLSDLNVVGDGTSERHAGYALAEQELLRGLQTYLNEQGIDSSKARIVITGQSRGAAVGNLLAADLSKGALRFSAERVCAYLFGTPNVTSANGIHGSAYGNIINVVNPEDPMTEFPLRSWGYNRYGRTYSLPSSTTNASAYSTYATSVSSYISLLIGAEFSLDSGKGTASGFTDCLATFAESASEFEEGKSDTVESKVLSSLGLPSEKELFVSLMDYIGNGPWYSGNDTMREMLLKYKGTYDDVLTYLFDTSNNCSQVKVTGMVRGSHSWEGYVSWMQALANAKAQPSLTADVASAREFSFFCPVDITVYDPAGKVAARIVNDEVVTEGIESETPVEAVVDASDGAKCVWMPEEEGWSVKVTATAQGTLDIVCKASTYAGDMVAQNAYNDLPLEVGTEYQVAVTEVAQDAEPLESIAVSGGQGAVEADYQASGEDAKAQVTVAATAGGVAFGTQQASLGSHVTVRALVDSGWAFVGWKDALGNVLSTQASYVVRVDGDISITAAFEQIPTYGFELGTVAFAHSGTEALYLVSCAQELPEGSAMGITLGDGTHAMVRGEDGAFRYLLTAEEAEDITGYSFTVIDEAGDVARAAMDVNGDGHVSVVDAQVAFDASNGVYVGFEVLSLAGWLAADANGDGAVDALDARAIQAYSLG